MVRRGLRMLVNALFASAVAQILCKVLADSAEVGDSLNTLSQLLALLAGAYLVAVLAFRVSTLEHVPFSEVLELTAEVLLGWIAVLYLPLNPFAPTLVVLLTAVIYRIWALEIRGPVPVDVDLTGKICLVTGSNSGIGVETARYFARNHATVIMACRDRKKAEAAHLDIVRTTKSENVKLYIVDLSKQEEVTAFADQVLQEYDRLDFLINNAGALVAPRREVSNFEDVPVELMLQVNHLAPFVLSLKLLPLLRKSTLEHGGRIVTVNSSMMKASSRLTGGFKFDDPMSKKDYQRFISYGYTKYANFVVSLELDRRLKANGDKVKVNSLMPGTIPTGITRDFHIFWRLGHAVVLRPLNKTATSGSYCAVLVATAQTNQKISGEFFEHGKPIPVERQKCYAEKDAKKLWELSEKLTGMRASDYGL